jgi:hypothetical protein
MKVLALTIMLPQCDMFLREESGLDEISQMKFFIGVKRRRRILGGMVYPRGLAFFMPMSSILIAVWCR